MAREDPANPTPETTPGLEPGSGVAPGDTPPIEASTTGASDRQPEPKGADAVSKGMVVAIIAGAVILGALILVWAVLHAQAL